jgi:UDP-N-acetylglucosamine--N-acetylmuramyl-(pentapeptide) pyrophosphoryl-undecaprenol N-acetylglucosamine transferase
VQPIVIAAGGTGGHFFPAEALAAEFLARGQPIVLMTDARSGALKSPVFAGHDTHVLKGAGLAGRGLLKAARAMVALSAGTLQARRVLRRIDAAAIVGFGGYPCVAPILAARTLRRRPRIVLHEQNAVLGRANRFLTKFADALALGFAGTKRVPQTLPLRVTGNPVRSAIAALANTGYEPPAAGPIELLVGGSLGARVFSDIVPEAVSALPQDLRARLRVVQQCRQEDMSRVGAAYAEAGIAAELSPFFSDMAVQYAAAHVVIGRAGASTCAELAAIGRPAILVPLPGAIDDHQTANARALADAGAALVLPQPHFTPATLTGSLTRMLRDPERLAASAQAATTCARLDAASDLANLVETLIAGAQVLR